MKLFFTIFSVTALIAFVVVVLLLLISSFRVSFFPLDARAVLSGSMEPAIPTGSVIFIYPSTTYEEGDIITYQRRDSSLALPITHRVMGKEVIGGVAIYITQGDANEYADGGTVADSEILGKMIFQIPFLGRLLDFVKTPIGFAILIIIPALLVIFDEGRRIMRIVKEEKVKKIAYNNMSSVESEEDGQKNSKYEKKK